MFTPSVLIDVAERDTYRLIPETKGRSLEEMDVIFGAVTEEKRRADIAARERSTHFVFSTRSRDVLRRALPDLQQEELSSEVADTKEEV